MKRKLISYPITMNAPVWPGNPRPELHQHSAIEKGDDANTWKFTLHNHCGTHFDAPKHFNDAGQCIAELPLDNFFYSAPLLVDIPKSFGEAVEQEDLQPYSRRIADADLLMLRTGFGALRESDPDRYASEGPAVSSRAAKYLVESFPNLKAIALDFISLASYLNSSDGNVAHHYMLGVHTENRICIIEDVRLADLVAEDLLAVAAIPLMISQIDSCPVTMWAELK